MNRKTRATRKRGNADHEVAVHMENVQPRPRTIASASVVVILLNAGSPREAYNVFVMKRGGLGQGRGADRVPGTRRGAARDDREIAPQAPRRNPSAHASRKSSSPAKAASGELWTTVENFLLPG